MEKKVTPYDTGKVKIGVYYQPPKFPMEDHELVLQNVLLQNSGFDDVPEPWYRKFGTWCVVLLGFAMYILLIGSL